MSRLPNHSSLMILVMMLTNIGDYRKKLFKIVLPLMDIKDISITISSQFFYCEGTGDDCQSFAVRFTKFYNNEANERVCKSIGEFDIISWGDKKSNNKVMKELKKFVDEFNIDNY